MQNLDSESQVKCTNNRVIMNTADTTTFTIENSILDLYHGYMFRLILNHNQANKNENPNCTVHSSFVGLIMIQDESKHVAMV